MAAPVQICGEGLHSGVVANLRIRPAKADTGISFKRVDIDPPDNVIPARIDCVSNTNLCTTIANPSGISVSTIEHLMASFTACGVHNAVVEIDQSELPGLDGSALDYARLILETGIQKLNSPLKVIKILQRVAVQVGQSSAALEPSEHAEIETTIDFQRPIGRQSLEMGLCNGAVARHLIDSRTFCLFKQIPVLHKMGLGLGGTFKKVLVADSDKGAYVGERRHKDECVRHKSLDSIGDLALAGYPIIGRYSAYRPGHGLTVALLRKLFETSDAFVIRVADEATAALLPGVGTKISDIPRH